MTTAATMATTFGVEKRSILTDPLAREALRPAGSSPYSSITDGPVRPLLLAGRSRDRLRGLCLSLDGLALGANLRNHRTGHLDSHAVGDLDVDVGPIVRDPRDLADDPAGGHHRVAASHVLEHLLMLLHPPLLRPDDQEPHDHEDEDERDEIDEHRVHVAEGGSLGESGRDQAALHGKKREAGPPRAR